MNRYIGTPKQPTLSVTYLNTAGEYELQQLRDDQRLQSLVFPKLQLRINQILAWLLCMESLS